MLDADETILRFADNYHLHLIAPADTEDKDFPRLHTGLKKGILTPAQAADEANMTVSGFEAKTGLKS